MMIRHLKGAIGIDLSTHTGYTKSAHLDFTFNAARAHGTAMRRLGVWWWAS